MSEEKKTVELKEEQLEKVAGGYTRGPTTGPEPPSGQGAPSCYQTVRNSSMTDTCSIKASCEGCDYIEDCTNKYTYVWKP